MIFNTRFVFSSLSVLAVQQAAAIPIRHAGPHEGKPEHKEAVKTAIGHANQAIDHMAAVHAQAVAGNAQALAHVHHAFGTQANLHEIGNGIEKLKSGKIQIQHANHPDFHGAGFYSPPPIGEVNFGTAFHTGSAQQRAGHVIHEASHHLLKTKDVFDKHGQPTSSSKPGPGEHVGYHDSHLHDIKNGVAAGQMHHNADSWRVFAHRASPNLVHLRRAFEDNLELELLSRFFSEGFSNDLD